MFGQRIHLDHARNGQVREGFPFSVACKVNGSPRLTVDWFKDGVRVHVEAASLRHIEVSFRFYQYSAASASVSNSHKRHLVHIYFIKSIPQM